MFEKYYVKKEHETMKNFSYSKGGVVLKFTLRVDIKKELKDFLELLREAEKGVEGEIKK